MLTRAERWKPEHRMKLRASIVVLLIVFSSAPALAQSEQSSVKPTPANESSVPLLGDIMNAVQTRHMKLWFAGKAQNWELAAYELRQLKSGLLEAAVMYEGIPVTNVTTMIDPVQSVADAIAAKDSKRFAKTVGELTEGCNGCHKSMERGFIVMRLPKGSPFSNQVFPPPR
jgi:ornithine carbamoyltransferase